MGRRVDWESVAKRSDRSTGEGAAIGGGVGALAAPGRIINGGGKHIAAHIRDLPPGQHMIDPRDLQRHTSASGIRMGDTAHVAALGGKLREHGYDASKGPVRLNVFHDRAMINDGNHRVHASLAAGVKKVPVEVTHAAGNAPAARWRGGQLLDAARGGGQRAYYRSHRNDDKWIDRRSKRVPKPGSRRAMFNEQMGARGTANAVRTNSRLKTLSKPKFAAVNTALIGTGAVVGAKINNRRNVKKSDLEWHQRKTSTLRAAGVAAGTTGLVYGGSRLGVVRSALRYGAKEGGNLGSLARSAERGRAAVERETAPLGTLMNRAPGIGGVANLVPAKVRPALATGLGYSAVRRSTPVRRDTYAPYNGTPARGW